MSKVPDNEDTLANCLCRDCPTNKQAGAALYCARGKSSLAVERVFCACKWCPLWSGYGLEKDFYCCEGAE